MIIQQFFGFSSPWSSCSHIHLFVCLPCLPCLSLPPQSIGWWSSGMSADTTTEGRESTESNSTGVYGTTLANQTPTTTHSMYPRGEDTDAKGAADTEPRNPEDVIGCGSSTTNRHRLLSTYYSLWLFISMKLTATPTTSLSHC